MDSGAIYHTIRDVVKSSIPGARVLLFGSRARGDNGNRSDYDLLIITPTTFTPQEKIHWSTRLDKLIVEAARIPVDLLLNSEDEVRRKQQLPGHIIRTAMREGVLL